MKPLYPFMVAAAMAPISLATPAQANPHLNRVHSMTQTQPMTAFFYRQPVVLDREKHRSLRLKTADARFAAQSQAVPLLVAEFPEASLEYPIVFAKSSDGQWMTLALTGLESEINAFVDREGKWHARYVPASVRRYPFILAQDDKQQLSLAVDMAATQIGSEGEPLFNDQGEPSETVRNIMSLMADFQSQVDVTESFIQRLDEAGILVQQNLQVQLGDGRKATVDGSWIVDEKKLRELPDDKVLAWFKGGELSAIHAHILSLRNLIPLLERHSMPAPLRPLKKPASKKTKS